jgi:hypothetical protein
MKTNTKHHSRDGKRLRWARNVIKEWENTPKMPPLAWSKECSDVYVQINRNRYERAAAIIVAHKLSQ